MPGTSTGALSRREAADDPHEARDQQSDGGGDPGDLQQKPEAREGGHQTDVRAQRERIVWTSRATCRTGLEEQRRQHAKHDDVGQIRCCDHDASDRCSESPGWKAQHGMCDQCGIGDVEDKPDREQG